MSEHTPGPWKAQGETISCATGYVAFATCNPRTLDETRDEGESWLDMRVRTSGDREELKMQVIANARLIAAAPEMLEALKMFLQFNDQGGPLSFDTDAMWAQARAAIAKAKGEQL